jgi:hypothetical protein
MTSVGTGRAEIQEQREFSTRQSLNASLESYLRRPTPRLWGVIGKPSQIRKRQDEEKLCGPRRIDWAKTKSPHASVQPQSARWLRNHCIGYIDEVAACSQGAALRLAHLQYAFKSRIEFSVHTICTEEV